LIDQQREYCANDEDVQRFFKRAVFMRHRLKTAFDLTVTEKSDALALLGRLFERIGLELRSTRRAGPRGQQVRYYSITETSFNDPDRLAVLDALNRKYANLTDEVGSQKSANYNNTKAVVATENGNQKPAFNLKLEQVLATNTVAEPELAKLPNPTLKGQHLSSVPLEHNLPTDSGTVTPTPPPQPSALGRAVEILTRCGQWLQGYFYVDRKGDRHQLADRTGYRGIFVTDDEFRFAAG